MKEFIKGLVIKLLHIVILNSLAILIAIIGCYVGCFLLDCFSDAAIIVCILMILFVITGCAYIVMYLLLIMSFFMYIFNEKTNYFDFMRDWV